MPRDQENDLTPEVDRFSRKIERVLVGQPSPVMDGSTEELVQVAQLIQQRLSDDLIDPGFREQLKQDLIDPGPRLLPFRPRYRRRYPIPAFAGALAVVMIATAAAGWMVLSDYSLTGNDSSLSSEGASISGAVAFVTPSAEEGQIELQGIGATNDQHATATPETAEGFNPGNSEIAMASNTATEQSASPTQTAQEPTALDLPPVDGAHIELGALATPRTVPSSAFDGVRFTLAGELPDLESSATIYEFSTPFVNARMILRGVAEFLGIEDEIQVAEYHGRMAYSLVSDTDGARFTWFPLSGAFSCSVPPGEPAETNEEISAAAIQWLRDFGFPIDEETTKPVIQTLEDGQRFVHVPLGELPETAIGHPVRVTLELDAEGRIVRASGYWLRVTETDDVPLINADQAWQRLQAGKGYWPERPSIHGDGDLVIENLTVSYILTTDATNKDLVLQPVIAAQGRFIPDNGEATISTTVYLQATDSNTSS